MRQYELVERVQRYKPDVNEALLNRAYVYAMKKHGHQRRASGDPYFSHPLEVAAILTDMHLDEATIAVALLHDTIEDTETTREELDTTFGAEIRQLVEEVTDDKELDKEVRKQRQIEHAPELSYRAKLIKLADLTCNLTDVLDDPPSSWSNERCMEYLEWTEQVIAGCRRTNKKLEQDYDRLVARGRKLLSG